MSLAQFVLDFIRHGSSVTLGDVTQACEEAGYGINGGYETPLVITSSGREPVPTSAKQSDP